MRDGTDEIIKTKLYGEIELLEQQYRALKGYLAGDDDNLEIVGAAKGFRDTLNAISMHVLTLYTLEGRKAKITWDSLITNIDQALETLQSSRSKPKSAIQLALNISEPKIEEVMSYLLTLKKDRSSEDGNINPGVVLPPPHRFDEELRSSLSRLAQSHPFGLETPGHNQLIDRSAERFLFGIPEQPGKSRVGP